MIKIFDKTAQDLGRIHFIGIGGIGMSGLAEVLYTKGFSVSGSDAAENGNVVRLRGLGVDVQVGHTAEEVDGVAVVVVSSAIQADNPALVAARAAGIQVVHRAEVLAEIMGNFKTIAVTGTHGKTSTTGLVWAALRAAKKDGIPVDVGVVNGGVLQELGTNAVLPKTTDGWLVVEADESDASFTKLKPDIGVVLNIEPEHMENFADEHALLAGFQTFVDACEMVVACEDDARVGQLTEIDVFYEVFDVVRAGWETRFVWQGEPYTVGLPGNHYAWNAAAALTVVKLVGGDTARAADGLRSFRGVARRFTKVGEFMGATVVDDYGHHPTEIAATIAAAQGVTDGSVIVVVQPHKFTRLRDNWDGFVTCMKEAEQAFVLPVYAAGQAAIAGVDSEVLAGESGAVFVTEEGLREALGAVVAAGDVILIMGAGDSTRMAKELVDD